MKAAAHQIALGILLSMFLASKPATAGVGETEKVETATDVVKQMTAIPEQAIPPELLKNAHGLAVIPGVIKAGYVVGGSYGTGILTVRNDQGGWSPPLFVKIVAGSVGWQIGAESTDLVLVFKTARSVRGIVKGTFTLGADAAVAAGPVGRHGEAATDAELKAEILSYSRSRGLFAGISLQGSKISIDHKADAAFYGKAIRPAEIIEGKRGNPEAGQKFLREVSKAMGD